MSCALEKLEKKLGELQIIKYKRLIYVYNGLMCSAIPVVLVKYNCIIALWPIQGAWIVPCLRSSCVLPVQLSAMLSNILSIHVYTHSNSLYCPWVDPKNRIMGLFFTVKRKMNMSCVKSSISRKRVRVENW